MTWHLRGTLRYGHSKSHPTFLFVPVDCSPWILAGCVSQMAPYSLYSALIMTRAHRALSIKANRVPCGKQAGTAAIGHAHMHS